MYFEFLLTRENFLLVSSFHFCIIIYCSDNITAWLLVESKISANCITRFSRVYPSFDFSFGLVWFGWLSFAVFLFLQPFVMDLSVWFSCISSSLSN